MFVCEWVEGFILFMDALFPNIFSNSRCAQQMVWIRIDFRYTLEFQNHENLILSGSIQPLYGRTKLGPNAGSPH